MSLLPRAARGHSVEPVRLEMETAFPQYPRGSFLRDYHWPVGPLRHTMVSFSAATVSFSFRRSKKFGPFRMTVSNTGVGYEFTSRRVTSLHFRCWTDVQNKATLTKARAIVTANV
jgi:hypothetical protein